MRTRHPVPPAARRAMAVVTALGLVGLLLWSRLAGIGQSFWHDEIHTVVNYASSPLAAFSEQYVPNNHVLFSVLAGTTATVFGQDETVYRIWAVVPAMLSVVLLSWWCWHRLGTAMALGIAAFLIVSPLHLELSRQARGYGLAFLAMTGLVVATVEFARDPRVWPMILLGISGAVGTMTLPVFVLPFIVAVAVLLVATHDRRLIGTTASVGLVSLAWYLPVLPELVASTGQDFGERLDPLEVVTQPVVDLVEPTLALIVPDAPAAVWVVLTYVLVALVFALPRDLPRHAWAGPGAAVLGTYGLLALLRFQTTDRFTSSLLIPAAVLVGIGAVRQVTVGSTRRRAAATTVAFLALFLMIASFVPIARQVAATPRENFAGVADVVHSVEDPSVLTNSARPLGLDYYITEPLEVLDEGPVQALCSTSPPVVYVEHRDKSPDLDESCLEQRGAELVRVPQRARGAYIDVWVLTGEG